MRDADKRSIIAWIGGLPQPNGGRKRTFEAATADQHQQLASPPTSLGDNDNTKTMSTPKRRRLESSTGPLLDPDATPRPPGGTRSIPSPSGSSSRSTSEASSVVSGTTSAKRQMMNLRLSESGVEYKALNVHAAPDTAQKLVSTIAEIGLAHDILPQDLKSTIMEKIRARNLDDRIWRHSFNPSGRTDRLPGRIPTFEEVDKVFRKANECQEFNHEEASWNNQVHLRLLESMFEEVLGGQYDDFNAVSW